ncbi:7334_t:CDS:1, partial [Gigaspora margarita]
MKQPFEDEKDDTISSNKFLKKQLDCQEEEAYLNQLSTNECCTSICLAKVNHNNGLIKYKQIQNYTKAKLDIFLLAMIEALIRTPEQTTKGDSKIFHTTLYQFEEVKICKKEFFIIFEI